MVNVEIVNIAASGDVGVEIDIEQLVQDVNIPVANYDPKFNAAFLRFEKDTSELVILYTSGKYIVRGGDTLANLHALHQSFLDLLVEVGILSQSTSPEFEIKNVVCVGDLGEEIDLNAALLTLGLERTEYEPEQFPGLVYRPDNPCVLLIFGSGKVVVTGGRSHEMAEEAFQRLKKRIVSNGK